MSKAVFILLVGLLISCKNNSETKTPELIEAQFNVDNRLLKESEIIYIGLDFSIKAPKSYSPMDSSFLFSLKKGLTTGIYEKANVLSGYINRSDSSLMLVLDISKINRDYFLSIRKHYQSLLNKNNNWKNIQLQEYRHNCFKIDQYLLQNDVLLNFRLICQRYDSEKPLFELIYIINKSKYIQNIKSVESSIGSLKCLTSKNKNNETH